MDSSAWSSSSLSLSKLINKVYLNERNPMTAWKMRKTLTAHPHSGVRWSLLHFLEYEEMTCGVSLPAYTRFDWLHKRDLIGWRFHRSFRSFKSWTFLNFCSEPRQQSSASLPTMQFGEKWRHPIQVNGEAFNARRCVDGPLDSDVTVETLVADSAY